MNVLHSPAVYFSMLVVLFNFHYFPCIGLGEFRLLIYILIDMIFWRIPVQSFTKTLLLACLLSYWSVMKGCKLLRTVEVMFINRLWRAECWNWKPTTAAGAFFSPLSTKIALAAVTRVSFLSKLSDPEIPKTVFSIVRTTNHRNTSYSSNIVDYQNTGFSLRLARNIPSSDHNHS